MTAHTSSLSTWPAERLRAALALPTNSRNPEVKAILEGALREAEGREAPQRAPGRVLPLRGHRDTAGGEKGLQRGSGAAQEPVSLVLPLPPSVNSYWRSVPASRNRMARVLISEQGRRFKAACRNAAAAQCKTPLSGDVSLRCVVYFKDRRRDLDNCIKPLLDALIGVLYRDDRQVAHLEFTKRHDARHPRVELVAASAGGQGASTG